MRSNGVIQQTPGIRTDSAITDGAAEMERLGALLRETSRTFSVSIEGLPGSLREQLTVAYLLFRVSDYLEDHETIDRGDKIELLERWGDVLGDADAMDDFLSALGEIPHRSGDPEATVAYASPSLIAGLERFPRHVSEAIRRRVRETTRGMAKWQAKGPRVEDEQELDDYMHHVAGIVGYLVTDLFASHSEAIARRKDTLMPLAREFGLALQTVNVIRGLKKDFERGWIFVPRTYCSAYGLTPAELFNPDRVDTALRVVDDLIDKAEQHLISGLAYVRTLPRRMHRLRLACMWPLLFAAKTIAVSRDNSAVLFDEVKIGRDTVKRIIRRSAIHGWSNLWLRRYTGRLLRGGNA